ncbi:putative sensor histidine kinase TcrY domain protein [Mycobacterium xenopi 3993]|nr:putative sensor histidine kinase TcrY domain protein [Mycobacterium xenopi 3993]
MRRIWSLRIRLLAGQIVVLALVCVGIGAVTELALYRYLMGQLDQQLQGASHRSAMTYGERPPPPVPWRHPRVPMPARPAVSGRSRPARRHGGGDRRRRWHRQCRLPDQHGIPFGGDRYRRGPAKGDRPDRTRSPESSTGWAATGWWPRRRSTATTSSLPAYRCPTSTPP